MMSRHSHFSFHGCWLVGLQGEKEPNHRHVRRFTDISLDRFEGFSYHIDRLGKMSATRRKMKRVALIPPEPDPKRHEKMLAGASGVMFYSRVHLAGYPGEPSSEVNVEQKKRTIFSKEACDYLGCSLRHLYWLVRNQGLPYFVFWLGPHPQYAFRPRDVEKWLKTYRGKGRELGLRKIRLSGSGETVEKGK
jgi:excisionase family DNA binding protein